ncbi:hypothetical protein [Salinibius halmophilus]|uniref:hypothetical protein n=1 Tax=Salinibius halmophilus TaxID=1853216 RepID=UPI000E66F7E9|nr:hypothetical protein [Salinibius halmophilus]
MANYSTNELSSLTLGAHGQVHITAYGNGIMYYEAVGPANLELLETFVSVDQSAITEFSEQFEFWCEVIEIKESCMILDDAKALLTEYLIETKKHGLNAHATAFVLKPDVEGAFMMAEIYEQIYSQAGFIFKLFDDPQAAFEWAESQRQHALKSIGAKKA